jgi:hypothetical protein
MYITGHSCMVAEDDVTSYVLVGCTTCQHVSLYREEHVKASPQRVFTGFRLVDLECVWPKGAELHKSVPDPVRKCYQEAAAIKSRAPNAFANQIRRALEALCRDRGATDRTLAKNLGELSSRGEIPPTLADMTDILRMLGNIGSHAAEESVEPEYVEPIDDFFRAVVEYVYVAPYRVNEVQAQLEYARKLRAGGK